MPWPSFSACVKRVLFLCLSLVLYCSVLFFWGVGGREVSEYIQHTFYKDESSEAIV